MTELVTNIQSATEVNINSVLERFEKLSQQFDRSEETSRIARKSSDKLQEEYCRIIHSVATERKRNLFYIEKAKQEFIVDLTAMSLKLQKAEALSSKIEKVKKDQIEVAKSLSVEVEQKKKAMERIVEERLLNYEKTYVTS